MDIFNKEEQIEYRKLLHSTGWNIIDKTQGFLSHYTSPASVYSILSEQKLWFTDCRYLNDLSEGYFVWDIVDTILKKNDYKKNFINSIIKARTSQEIPINEQESVCCDKFVYYVCSFSENDDSLSLWNYYAKTPESAGYNLVFNKKSLIDSIIGKNSFEKYDYSLIRVIYKKDKQMKCLEPIIDFFYGIWLNCKSKKRAFLIAEMYHLLQLVALGFKNEAYEDEKEVRLILHLTEVDNHIRCNNANILRIRVKGNYFIPYLSLSIDRNALDKIVASPYIKDKTALDSLKLLTQKLELQNRNVVSSEIPARF